MYSLPHLNHMHSLQLTQSSPEYVFFLPADICMLILSRTTDLSVLTKPVTTSNGFDTPLG